MLKKLLLPLSLLTLTGCNAQTVQPVAPWMLPSINQSTQSTPAVPTRTELINRQPANERAALAGFVNTKQASVIETSQSIQFPFGRLVPNISCLPLHACDIALQSGEKVTGVYPGGIPHAGYLSKH